MLVVILCYDASSIVFVVHKNTSYLTDDVANGDGTDKPCMKPAAR